MAEHGGRSADDTGNPGSLDEEDSPDGHPGADGHHPEWRLLVAPVGGTFRAGQDVTPGTRVAAGAELARVEARAGQRPITPPFPGVIIEWLAEDGDPVSAGQPLVRLEPESGEPGRYASEAYEQRTA
ncbi:MAG TPA: acetyl-CoA carboxylase biotin carboxyl carrier protein subunit [Streptosporangiaceae bacterium]|nr:acetyl-CoA carboxylase biotin carboxyl carrier protein subunit [Streptosporangiaceae bacterium]